MKARIPRFLDYVQTYFEYVNAQAFQSRNAMIEQAEEISKERPVTAEDMSNIVVNYLAQTRLDEKAQKILKKLCLQMFKGTE